MTSIQVDKIRSRVWHSISPQTAAQAGPDSSGNWMKMQHLQRFISFTFMPSDEQLTRLACYLGVKL